MGRGGTVPNGRVLCCRKTGGGAVEPLRSLGVYFGSGEDQQLRVQLSSTFKTYNSSAKFFRRHDHDPQFDQLADGHLLFQY
jgi:hypothetical protein